MILWIFLEVVQHYIKELNMLGNCPYCFGNTDTAGNCWNINCPKKKGWENPEYPTYPINPVPAPSYPTGWICPKCGAGLSPTTTKCDCHVKYYTTTGTDIGTNRDDT
jgi:hypothetical protein